MGLVMLISLYTSRVLLSALGEVDYGIYNLVGSVVVMFSFFNNILTIAIRRFLSVAISSEDNTRIYSVFKACVRAVMIVAIIITFVLETGGVWFLNNKLDIPYDRLTAANWVFHLSVLSFILNLNALPYNAAIVSYEKMHIYAYVGILEVVLKLLFTLCVFYAPSVDKLILYSVLFFVLSNLIRFIDVWYCRKKIFNFDIEKNVSVQISDVKSIFSFSFWAVLGSVFYMLATQGVTILMNINFGIHLSAAMGIVMTVSNAVSQFGSNFTTAFNPALTKSYAVEGLSGSTYSFLVRVSKISVILVLLICVPLLLRIEEILDLWLVDVPALTSGLCSIAIIYVAIDIISSPLYILVYADGDVKRYSILLSIIQIIYVIGFYISCKLGASPITAYSLNVLCAVLLFFARLYMLKTIMKLNVLNYLKDVYLRLIIPILLVVLLNNNWLISHDDNFVWNIIFNICVFELFLILILFLLYLNREEKENILRHITKR